MRLLFLCIVLLVAATSAGGEQLPVKSYTIADGLVHERVRCIVRDSHGFLWFCTGDGLSRFDGYTFTNYGIAEGLSEPAVSALVEGQGGLYWVATMGGVAVFNPAGGRADYSGRLQPTTEAEHRARFQFFTVGAETESNHVLTLYKDREGRVWVGTTRGLFFTEESDAQHEFHGVDLLAAEGLPRSPEGATQPYVFSVIEDAEGSLWAATSLGLFRRLPDGRVLAYFDDWGGPSANCVLEDEGGRLWIGFDDGLMVYRPEPVAQLSGGARHAWRLEYAREETHLPDGRLHLPETVGAAHVYAADDGLADSPVWVLRQMSDGRVWIVTRGNGVAVYEDGRLRRYTTEQGLSDRILNAAAEDIAGNVWLGTETSGAIKIARRGFTTFRDPDGLGRVFVRTAFETVGGEMCAVMQTPEIFCLDGDRFVRVRVNIPEGLGHLANTTNEFPFQDREGEWWVMTTRGLYHFPAVKRVAQLSTAQPLAVYTDKTGLPSLQLTALFEDSRGDIWIGTSSGAVLTRWERRTGELHVYTEADGVPPFRTPLAFAEDRAGSIWVGFKNGDLLRLKGGRFRLFGRDDGVPPGTIPQIYIDRAGRLWAPTNRGGVLRVEDPTMDGFSSTVYTTAQGLSSANTRSVVEDSWGRIYVGTVRGVDRLDLDSGRVKHFTTADGLSYSELGLSYRDHTGALWFTTYRGLSKYIPEKDTPQPPPQPLIRALRVAGVPYNISELGEGEVSSLELGPEQGQLQIDFFALSFATGESLRYQYKFEGQDAEWSQPSAQRSVSLRLAPGSYRFLVRAVNADGEASPVPASFAFQILPPVWRRWWFIALVALAAGVAALAAQRRVAARRRGRERAESELRRAKEERLVELERVRKRIATDLHDDIGASLTQIAVLSEVARQGLEREGAHAAEQLAHISSVSNELVETMSDIVWAINPRKDHLSDLVHRMRRFASDVFTTRGIAFGFHAPDSDHDARLGANIRREVFLIFKETVNNISKHSDAHHVEIDFAFENDRLTLRVGDDGKGFDTGATMLSGEREPSDGTGGTGLYSLRRRAREMGGSYEVHSSRGEGATAFLSLPVGPPPLSKESSPHPNGW